MNKENKEIEDFEKSIIVEKPKIFGYIYNIISRPTLMLHELSHMLFGLIFGLKIIDSYIASAKKKVMNGYVDFEGVYAKRKIDEYFISLSPILILLIPLILSFFTVYALPFLIYFLITSPFVLPSKDDLIRIVFYDELVSSTNFETIKKKFENLTYFDLIKKLF